MTPAGNGPSGGGRVQGYAPLRSYAAVGDGRTVALIAADGSIDWLCSPDMDSPAVFGAVLDAASQGLFALAPVAPSDMTRRYVPGTNVLESTYRTSTGTVRVTDAMTLPGAGLCPQREMARAVEGVSGTVRMAWTVKPRFGFGAGPTRIGLRGGVPVATRGADALAVCSWGVGAATITSDSIGGSFDARAGTEMLFALAFAHQEPLVIPGREQVESRLLGTATWWRAWSAGLSPVTTWSESVVRSALALRLLVHAPSGAIAAAATTSLPEVLGGERNWDYRYCWVRDSAFVLGALLRLGQVQEADAFFWWLMAASQLTHPRLRVLYRLDGGSRARERTLPLSGYRNSRPVRVGNGASEQVQLDVYGDLLQAAWLYGLAGRPIDADIGRRLAEIADLVCRIWSQPDAGLWEVRSSPLQFTQSKMMCCIALDRAMDLARRGVIPSDHQDAWRREADAVRAFIEERCWSVEVGSYVRSAGSSDLDASLLLGVLFRYGDVRGSRMLATVEAIRQHLSDGPFVHRYSGEDGLGGQEGAFLTCSFWLVEALAVQGRRAEASALMTRLVGLANDVGLYAEEIDPAGGAFLGNMPQALTHLGLIHAALALQGNEDA